MRSFLLVILVGCANSESDPTDPTDPTEVGETVRRSDEAVSFAGPAHDLEGTLTLPARVAGERVPAVVLMHGSGPNSRDVPMPGQLNLGFGFVVEVFVDLADGMAAEGIATLRYDKRTCFTGNGCTNAYPTPAADTVVQDFIEDAEAAVDFLAAHPDVDPDQVFIVGHSQGASFLPQMLTDHPELAGGVMLAGGFRPIDELIAFQYTSTVELLEQAGYGQSQIEPLVADLAQWVADLEALRAGTFTGTAIGGASVAFWSDWLALTDEAPALATSVTQPIRVVGGDYDWNVPAEEALAWGERLGPLGRGHEATVLPCVTHALNCISEPNFQRIGPDDIGDAVDPAVIEALVAWVER